MNCGDDKLTESCTITIDFLIVGAEKCGTTSLHRYLSRHPEVYLPEAKELAFFVAPKGDESQRRLVERYYSSVPRDRIVGLSDVSMLLLPHVPERIREHNPEARVVALVRNPIERAHSAFWAGKLRGSETCESFEQALNREKRGELRSHFDRVNFSYVERGHYAEQIERYFSVLGRDRVRVLMAQDLAEKPRETLRGLLSWLGVAPRLQGLGLGRLHNVTSTARFPRVESTVASAATPVWRLLRPWVPEPARLRLRRSVQSLLGWNRVPFRPPPMKSNVRERLRDHFRPHNDRLAQILGRDLSEWG